MRIKQAAVSRSIVFFERRFRDRYRLEPYLDRDSPAVFFGCYRAGDVDLVMQHRSLAVLVWGGSDVMRADSDEVAGLRAVLTAPHVRHIAIGGFVAADLERIGVECRRVPVAPVDEERYFRPNMPLGDRVYVYSNHSNEAFYGKAIIDEVVSRLGPLGVEFVRGYATPPNLDDDCVPAAYASCCCGLRPLLHDGLSCTVLEMGMMGRKTIHNDASLPCTIGWRGVDDICESIMAERSKAGTTRPQLALAVRSFLNFPHWLESEWYA